jgi:hypothetical protein
MALVGTGLTVRIVRDGGGSALILINMGSPVPGRMAVLGKRPWVL